MNRSDLHALMQAHRVRAGYAKTRLIYSNKPRDLNLAYYQREYAAILDAELVAQHYRKEMRT